MIDQPSDEQPKRPLQFGLRTLVIAQGLVAVVVAMFVTHPVLGFLTLLALTLGVGAIQVQADREPPRRICFDLLAAVVLPIAATYALAGKGDFVGALLFVLMVAWLPMLMLVLWFMRDLRQDRVSRYFRGFAAGIFVVWGFILGIGGLLLFPVAIASALPSLTLGRLDQMVAVTAFTPLIAAYAFMRNTGRALQGDWERQPNGFPAGPFMLGMLLAFISPFALYVLMTLLGILILSLAG